MPTVLVPDTSPFTVRGLHFRPGERVKILVRSKGSFHAQTTAAADGSFSAILPEVKFDECSGYLVKAEGNLGSRAARKLPRPECGVPPDQRDAKDG